MFARHRSVLSAIAVLAISVPIAADIVLMKSGKQYNGDVVEKGDSYVITTADGTHTVKKSDVGGIVKTGNSDGPKNPGGGLSPVAAPSNEGSEPKRSSAAERMLNDAKKAVERSRFREARTIATRIVKQYPDSLEAFEAKALLEDLPHPDGRLICGFDSAGDMEAWRIEKFFRHPVTWKLTNEKIAIREGEGSAQLGFTRDPDYTTGAVILELDDFDPKRFRGLSLWVFQPQPSGGRLELAFIRPDQQRLVWVDAGFGGSEMGACIYYAVPMNSFRGWKQFKIPAQSFKPRGASGVRGKITWYDVGALVLYDASRKGIDCYVDSLRFIETPKK